MEFKDLLDRAKKLPLDKQRRIGAIIGALTADAASQPLHWEYDDDTLREAIKGYPEPEFLPQSANPYYSLPTGSQAPYGDQEVILLRSLVECKGLDIARFRDATFKGFGPGSPYDHPGQHKRVYPMQGKYLESTVGKFLKSYSSGTAVQSSEGGNVDGYSLGILPPLVALYASHPDLLKHVEEAVSQLQPQPMVLAIAKASSRLIELYIQGNDHPLEKVLKELSQKNELQVMEYISAVLQSKDLSVHDATNKLGKACYVPGVFQSALRSLLDDQGYVPAVREVIVAGGNNCLRLALVGACLGAKYGLDSIPLTWLEKTDAAREALELSLALVELPV